MPRIARIIAPHFPHHITQRGNRRQQVFFKDEDYNEYLRLLKFHGDKFNLSIVAYCLMPNHVHLIVIPEEKESIAKAIGETHRKYTRMINFRNNWSGYLWQGRFSSYILDERYLLSATRYALLNPVRAKMVKTPQSYRWSSVRHHLGLEKSQIVNDSIFKETIVDWNEFLTEVSDERDIKLL
ncbi:MAG: transposase, partial [bacterium]